MVLPSVSPAHTGPGQPQQQGYWSHSGQVQGSRAGRSRALGLDSSRTSACHPQDLPCPSEHGQEAAVTW